MGVRLIVEVLDHWQDHGLTAGERGDLIVVAENANDRTRETYGPLHQPYILQRAGKGAAGWKNALGKLVRKGVLAYAVRDGRTLSGFPGQHAVYRVVVLCPEPPHDGHTGQCTRPEMGHLSGDPNGRLGHLSDVNGSPERCERVTSQVTPTPLTPQDSSSLHARAAAALRAAGASEDETRRVIENIKTRHNPRDVSAYVRRLSENGDLEALVEEVRAEHATADRERDRAALREKIERAERDGPHCEHGTPGGAFVRPDTGLPHCAICRTQATRTEGTR